MTCFNLLGPSPFSKFYINDKFTSLLKLYWKPELSKYWKFFSNYESGPFIFSLVCCWRIFNYVKLDWLIYVIHKYGAIYLVLLLSANWNIILLTRLHASLRILSSEKCWNQHKVSTFNNILRFNDKIIKFSINFLWIERTYNLVFSTSLSHIQNY